MVNFVYITDIIIVIYFLKDYIYISFYFSKINYEGNPFLAKIRSEIYLVEKLKAKILVNNHILIFKIFLLDLSNQKAIIFISNIKL